MKDYKFVALLPIFFCASATLALAQTECNPYLDPECFDYSASNLTCSTSDGGNLCWDSTEITYGDGSLGIIGNAQCGEDSELGSIFAGDTVAVDGCIDPWSMNVYASISNSYVGDEDEGTIILGTLEAQAQASDETGLYGSWNGYATEDCEGNTGGEDPPTVYPC